MSVQVKERWLRCGGYGTRFLEAGDPDAEPLLLIHDGAWGGSASTTWANLIPLLAPYRRVLAPDMLGYGASDKAVFLDRSPYAFRIAHLADFLRVLGISAPIDVVGNSFGGSTALRSLVMPDSFPIRSVVSIAGSGGPWRTPAALGELSRWDGTREDLARVVRFLVDDFPGFEEHLTERLRWASVPGHYKAIQAPTGAVPESLRPAIHDPWPEQLRDVTQPILLVSCTRDQLIEPEWAARVSAVNPTIRVVEIDHPHSPNIDRPDEVARILGDFLGFALDSSIAKTAL